MSKAILFGVLLVFAVGLVGAACGGGGEEETTNPPSGTEAIKMKVDDYFFEPKKLSLEAGKRATIELQNEGEEEHTFTIDELRVNKDLQAGEKGTVSFTPDRGGSFVFYCQFHSTTNGMEGSLSVAGSQGGAAPGGTTPAPSGATPGPGNLY